MQITFKDIITAAERVDLTDLWEDDYRVCGNYTYTDTRTCLSVALPDTASLAAFVAALAVLLTENGRTDDALRLARLTRTEQMSGNVLAYWPGVHLAD